MNEKTTDPSNICFKGSQGTMQYHCSSHLNCCEPWKQIFTINKNKVRPYAQKDNASPVCMQHLTQMSHER